MKKWFILLALTFLVVVLLRRGFAQDGGGNPDLGTITLTADPTTLKVGDELTLTATLSPAPVVPPGGTPYTVEFCSVTRSLKTDPWPSPYPRPGTPVNTTTATAVLKLHPGASYYKFRAFCGGYKESNEVEVTVVGVQKIVGVIDQAEVDGPLTTCLKEAVHLKAKPFPTDATFPAGAPTWGFAKDDNGNDLKPPGSFGTLEAQGDSATLTPDVVGNYVIEAKCGTSSARITVTAKTGTWEPDPPYPPYGDELSPTTAPANDIEESYNIEYDLPYGDHHHVVSQKALKVSHRAANYCKAYVWGSGAGAYSLPDFLQEYETSVTAEDTYWKKRIVWTGCHGAPDHSYTFDYSVSASVTYDVEGHVDNAPYRTDAAGNNTATPEPGEGRSYVWGALYVTTSPASSNNGPGECKIDFDRQEENSVTWSFDFTLDGVSLSVTPPESNGWHEGETKPWDIVGSVDSGTSTSIDVKAWIKHCTALMNWKNDAYGPMQARVEVETTGVSLTPH